MTDDKGVPGYQGRLNDQCVTIAEVLQPAGYFTAMTGKWHVGQNLGVTPWGRGFQRSLNAAAGGFFFPESDKAKLFLNGTAIENDDPRLPKNWYSTDLWTSFGLKFIDEARTAKQPFFLYLAHNAPHFPLQVPEEDIAKFRGKYMAGWGAIRDKRYERQLELGIIDTKWAKSPRPAAVQPWNNVADEEKKRFDQLMAVYAAVVHRMDKAVGDLVQGLNERGVLDSTLILFMSDNGGNAEAGPNGRTNGDPTKADSSWFCGESWAFPQNTPFRLYKHYNHEGGIATPLIAHWPAGITAKNELRKHPSHLIDVMATCVDVSKATYPTKLNDKSILPMEGKSLVPAFNNQNIERDGLYWEHEGNAAVRVGDMKLVRQGRDAAWELYDMSADRTELHNLANEKPDLTAELSKKWETWAHRAQVLPYPTESKAATNEGAKKKGKGKKKAKESS
jgi:arylsulfatase